MRAIVHKMRRHRSCVAVQAGGCRALAVLLDASMVSIADLEARKKMVTVNGGIGALVAAMQQMPLHAEVQEHGCWALASLAKKNDENQTAISDGNGIEAIVSALSHPAHRGNATLHIHGCRALRNLAAKHSTNKELIALHGGVSCLVASMQAHKRNAGVQEEASRALANLAAANAANQTAIARENGMLALVEGMGLHLSNARVQVAGCLALGNLACQDENKVLITDAGGIQALVSSMRAHSRDAEVQEEGCWALLNTGWDGPRGSRRARALMAAGGVAVVRRAMRSPNATARTVEWAELLLRRLAPLADIDKRQAGAKRLPAPERQPERKRLPVPDSRV